MRDPKYPRLVCFQRTKPANELEQGIRNVVFEDRSWHYLNVATLEPWSPGTDWVLASDDESETKTAYMLPETKEAIDRNYKLLLSRREAS